MDSDISSLMKLLSLDQKFDYDYFPKWNEVLLEHNWPNACTQSKPSWLRYISSKNKSYDLEETNEIDYIHHTFRQSNLHIIKLEKVSVPYLERAFTLKKMKKFNCNTRSLYHATRPENIDSILRNNFNWRLYGSSKGNKHGKGVSFSPRAGFSNMFCKSSVKCMIIADILYCDVHVGSSHHTLPLSGYDTTRSNNGNVYVKFEDNEFYPNI
ncbi:hypothetical protein HHI36_007011 [Cryptolaemus montrouzieri]|uniref:Poly [ADP-ribose] polymerase n=1 Tax=Cryptolaemus montrouzieri TaxID=559131 RepID=A0ABD2MNB1_9CUCU